MCDVGPVEETEAIEHLDFEPACHFGELGNGEDCEEPARWRLINIPCGCSWLICDQHRLRILVNFAIDDEKRRGQCINCGDKIFGRHSDNSKLVPLWPK